ncbi:DUF305 domain-containing protein [Herbihabitans rhizosphaerae]|uniref:DUF305 domain-containing protein n=1 Tax=Herbihabitans rhizosphaerae TaxID=1872711 RepID=UPI001F5F4AE3|nr:DUF305 domain-containing protein [Herbihabitans rhizosphaerae]
MASEDTEVQDDQLADEERPSRQAPRALVLSAAALAVLLVGAAIGMLITFATVDEPTKPTEGSVDVGFSQDMQVHHLQAVTMANIARETSTDESVRRLAFDIQSTQLGQVGEMAGWLTVWGQPEAVHGRQYMTWMSGAGGHAHGGQPMPDGGMARMPGMASTEELNKLRALRGPELDVFFLQLMLRHHQGGLGMAQFAAQRATEPYVRNLAQKMVDGQKKEVEFMTTLLAQRGAAPLP